MPEGPHRDDLSFETAEALTAALEAAHPGCRVVFAGDVPGGLPPDVARVLADLEARMLRSAATGTCFECGAAYPGDWPPPEGTRLAKGWGWCEAVGGMGEAPGCLICDPCDDATPVLGTEATDDDQ